jgi:hypothetical protein
MKLIDLHWNDNTGEGRVKFSKAFEDAHIVVKLDMLVDCIFVLTNKYDGLLTPPSEPTETN